MKRNSLAVLPSRCSHATASVMDILDVVGVVIALRVLEVARVIACAVFASETLVAGASLNQRAVHSGLIDQLAHLAKGMAFRRKAIQRTHSEQVLGEGVGSALGLSG